jgi:hypothetical protein
MNAFEQHIAKCREPGCIKALETNAARPDELCSTGRFILEKDLNLNPET